MGFGHGLVVSFGNVPKLPKTQFSPLTEAELLFRLSGVSKGRCNWVPGTVERSVRGTMVVLIYHCPAAHDEASALFLTIAMVLFWDVWPFKGRCETLSRFCVR